MWPWCIFLPRFSFSISVMLLCVSVLVWAIENVLFYEDPCKILITRVKYRNFMVLKNVHTSFVQEMSGRSRKCVV